MDVTQLVGKARQAAVATDEGDRILATNRGFHELVGWSKLLDSINFTGVGNYLPPRGGNPALRAQALALAATLDAYNNGELCP